MRVLRLASSSRVALRWRQRALVVDATRLVGCDASDEERAIHVVVDALDVRSVGPW